MNLTRRHILRALGGTPLLLPFVPLLEPRADSAMPPKRLVFLYSSNGTVREQWVPQMEGGSLVLSPILAPLEAFKDRLLVIDGLDYSVVNDKGEQSGHYGGMNTVLTGTMAKILDPNDPDQLSLAMGPSIDQVVAATVSAGLKFKSLECGIQVEAYTPTVAATSYADALQPILPDDDPYSVFERVFQGLRPGGGVNPEQQARLDARKSVLDFVAGDLSRLQGQLPGPERARIEAHLESVRQVEMQLFTGQGAAATDACEIPSVGRPVDVWDNDAIPQLGRLQIDLLVMALACDLTRVGTIQYGRAGAQHRFTWLGPEFQSDPDNGPNDSTSGIHGLAHNDGNPDSREKLARCHAWYAGEMAYLMERLAAIPEGDGSMLDNTLIVWMNEMGTGGSHSLEQTPWVLGGNVDGYFETGRVLAFPGQPHNRLLVSIGQAMGLDLETFGDPEYGDGPLTGLA